VIAILAVGTVVLIPVAIVVAILAFLAGLIGSVAERDLGVGLFADRDA